MIELDIIAYLNSDSTLDTLLGASGSDSKIYPIQAPHKRTIPYIVYTISSEGTDEENIREVTISFDCISDNYIQMRNIVNRLDTLLNKEDNIRSSISSTDYYLYWGKRTGGSTFKDPDVNLYHRVTIYDFKYGKVGT